MVRIPVAAFTISILFCTLTALGAEPVLPREASESWWDQVRQDIVESEYEITWQDETVAEGLAPSWQAPNRAQRFRTYFTAEGIRVVPRSGAMSDWSWGLELIGYGRVGAPEPVQQAALSVDGKRIEYLRGALTEWYVNDRRGLKQGFTLHLPPEREGGDELVLVLGLDGTLVPTVSADGQAVDFRQPGGPPAVRYAELIVTDARGIELPARMEASRHASAPAIRIVIDASNAAYPITVDPLATSPSWSAEGDQGGANFGWSVGTAGDVDNDGDTEIIVGANGYDHGFPGEGRAFLYPGSPSGPATSPTWTASGGQVGAAFGIQVGTAGNVNGDEFADVIVGVYGYDGQTGRAQVFYGSATGLSPTADWTVEGEQAGSRFGRSAATAGDVNGDTYSDVVVGADQYDGGEDDEGRIYLFYGSATGLSPTAAWAAESNDTGASLGISVATAGDVNGDGKSDIIAGAFHYDSGILHLNEGAAFVFHGASSIPSTVPDLLIQPDVAQSLLGGSVGTAGDVNGDGYADVIIGADDWDAPAGNAGAAFVHYGSVNGLSATPDWTVTGIGTDEHFGRSVGTAGDVNGDGYADVVVGADSHDGAGTDSGRVLVYHGSAAGLATTASWSVDSGQGGARLGRSVATAGDVNGDGFSDVIAGAISWDGEEINGGAAFIYYGSAAGLSTGPAWDSVNAGDSKHGFSVASAGDVNGDGYADVIVGAPDFGGASLLGRAYVYHGGPDGLATTFSFIVTGTLSGERLGYSVASAGDVNGDGYSDVIVSSPYHAGNRGEVTVYRGTAGGVTSLPLWEVQWTSGGQYFGWSVAGAGDVNGDGLADIVVGTQFSARAYLYLGPLTSGSQTLYGNECFGRSVSSAGDVDGDGYFDVIVGNPCATSNQGEAQVLYGFANGISGSGIWTVTDDQGGAAAFGASVSGAGDVDGDGYSDVIVGAPDYSNDESGEGRAFVYLGGSMGPSTTPAWTAEGDEVDACYGSSVAGAGDVNGDGLADVVVGAPCLDDAVTDDGQAYLYLGATTGLVATPWTASPAGEDTGRSVAGAGDVNGDGFADVIVGTPGGAGEDGYAHVYWGNEGPGLADRVRQRQPDDSEPLARLGLSDSHESFLVALQARTPFGRGLVAPEVEVKPRGETFDGSGTLVGAWTDVDDPLGVALTELVGGLQHNTLYHWRVRLRYDPVTLPFQLHGPWRTPPWDGWNEADLRTEAQHANIMVSQSDTSDPVFFGEGNLEYQITVYNNGPDNVPVTFTAQAGSPSIAANFVDVDTSHGSCQESSGVVTCDLGVVAAGFPASINLELDPQETGTYRNLIEAQGVAIDPSTSNNSDTELTQVVDRTADFEVTKTDVADPVPLGNDIEYEITVTNHGPHADSATVTDTLPADVTFVSAGGSCEYLAGSHEVQCSTGSLSPAASAIYGITVTPQVKGTLVNSVGVAPTLAEDPEPSNDQDTEETLVPNDVDLTVTLSDAADPVSYGESVVYTATVTNQGPDGDPVMLIDTLPVGVTFVQAVPSQGSGCVEAAGVVTCDLGLIGPGGMAGVVVEVAPDATGIYTNSVAVVPLGTELNPADNTAVEGTTVRQLVGDRVWLDLDGDGLQDAGEPGVVSALVYLFDDSGSFVDVAFTDTNGSYSFDVAAPASYFVRFIPPPGHVLSPLDQGGDDALDSDADPVTGDTAVFAAATSTAEQNWDAGVVPSIPCVPPDESVYLYDVTLTSDGNDYAVLHFMDPNQPDQITGYNVYRSSDQSVPRDQWPVVASNVIDMDEATPNKQWVDTSGDEPPGGVWYYDVTAYNDRCPAEGPR
ncbi:MAG: DUF11 domain-containing protein [bacterium]|nr:DUF11 domain-containing protein [bacterium]